MLGSMATIDASPVAEQYRALTEQCGLVDRSERGKLALSGSDAPEFLSGQVTNDVVALTPGDGCYAALLTHKGKMLGDLRILATEDELLLDTERVALQALFDTIRRFKIGHDVELHKRTLERSLISLIGPNTPQVLGAVCEGSIADELPSREHAHALAALGGHPVRLIRTDLGIDLLFDSTAIEPVRAALEKAGAIPSGEAAAEIVRVEHGRPRYGVDVDEATIPQEAGLNERAVSFTKGCYVGQETVARLYYKGKPNRLLRGLRLSEHVPAGSELLLDDRVVGTLSSSVLSPTLGPIGLALVRVAAAPPATLAIAESDAHATLVELPFG
jgi:tRNA-modifying protein YgfZ